MSALCNRYTHNEGKEMKIRADIVQAMYDADKQALGEYGAADLDYGDLADAVIRALESAGPIYQVNIRRDKWVDVTKIAYDAAPESGRRMVFLTPQKSSE